MSARNDLQRFVDAQEADSTYNRALRELRAARKESHWMWFIFPQIAGLGRSSTAQYFAIADLAEAQAYLAHPVLGARLVECARALLDLKGSDPAAVMGSIDAQKLCSSMTLFAQATPEEPAFPQVLEKYFAGETDQLTLRFLSTGASLRSSG